MQLQHCNESIMARESWQALGRVLPQDLIEARLLCHCAVQLLAASSYNDDDHGCAQWLAKHGALVGQGVGAGDQAVRLGLRVADLTLMVLDGAADQILARVPLDGGTMTAALGWMSTRIEQFTGAPLARPLALREHDMPDHPAARGKAFVIGSEIPALEELARWCHDASAALSQIRADTAEDAPVACWPRHMDIATRVYVEPRSEQTLAVGLCPGDRDRPEPYWYVRPWPRSSTGTPPAIADATGNSSWTESGVVLPGSDVIGDGSAYAQETRSLAFLRSAINASRSLRRG